MTSAKRVGRRPAHLGHAEYLLLRELGARIALVRGERGVTQRELAERLGVTVSYVSMLERGVRNPPMGTVLLIARALGVSARLLAPQ